MSMDGWIEKDGRFDGGWRSGYLGVEGWRSTWIYKGMLLDGLVDAWMRTCMDEYIPGSMGYLDGYTWTGGSTKIGGGGEDVVPEPNDAPSDEDFLEGQRGT